MFLPIQIALLVGGRYFNFFIGSLVSRDEGYLHYIFSITNYLIWDIIKPIVPNTILKFYMKHLVGYLMWTRSEQFQSIFTILTIIKFWLIIGLRITKRDYLLEVEFSNGITISTVSPCDTRAIRPFRSQIAFGLKKLPWNIDINEYIPGQKWMDAKKLKLASSMFDPTFVKEILGYSIYQQYLPAPEANFMRVELEGEYLGLYINTETIDKRFLKKHFNENDGVLFKCDPIQRYAQPGPRGTSDLSWLGSDSALYYNHYKLKSDHGWKELIQMIDILNHRPDQLDSVLNVDRVLWAFAVNQAISNFDTYNGFDPRNYYLYQTKDGLFQMIPWDVSESFINGMLGDVDHPREFYQYDPFNGTKSLHHPLNKALVGDPTSRYGKLYTAHLRTILEESLGESELLAEINRLQSIAEPAAATDQNTVWNMRQFESNVYTDFTAFGYSFAGIMETVERRNAFLKQHPELLKEPPVIAEVNVDSLNNQWYITTDVSNSNSVELMVSNNSYNSKFKSFGMNDYGLNGDAVAGDGIYTAPIPRNEHNTETKFYIRASNSQAIQLSPQRAEYEFYIVSTPGDHDTTDDLAGISVFPNPTQGIFCLKGDFYPESSYEVVSAHGSKVLTGDLNSRYNWINLTNQAPGMYLIKVGKKTYKIVKTN